MNRVFFVILVHFLLLLLGCASTAGFSTIEKNIPALPDTKARIYFYRVTSDCVSVPEIRLNGRAVGKAKGYSVFFVDIDPGNKEVENPKVVRRLIVDNKEMQVSSEGRKKLTFTVAAGETRYVKLSEVNCRMILSPTKWRMIPKLVEEGVARNEMVDLHFTGKEF